MLSLNLQFCLTLLFSKTPQPFTYDIQEQTLRIEYHTKLVINEDIFLRLFDVKTPGHNREFQANKTQ